MQARRSCRFACGGGGGAAAVMAVVVLMLVVVCGADGGDHIAAALRQYHTSETMFQSESGLLDIVSDI